MLNFRITAQDGAARAARLELAQITMPTPAFMPVGTAASVKGVLPQQLRETGATCLLANCYHLMLRPGAQTIAELGGLHRFMGWERLILTDSGGYQVMSLAKLRRLTDKGVQFQSHIDGSRHCLTPERSVEIQRLLGANIVMVLDECIALPAPKASVTQAMERSLRWAERSKAAFEAGAGKGAARPLLFGIVQGGTDEALRLRSARALQQVGFDGYAIGGLAVGEGQAAMLRTVRATAPALPAEQPRYLMGVGTPDDLVQAVALGVDMFDCVLPTRAGRHGVAYGWFGQFNLRNQRFAADAQPLDAASPCPASSQFSRAYLHHLFKAKELLGQVLLSWHNLAFYQELMAAMRQSIAAQTFDDFVARWKAGDPQRPDPESAQR